ncbi:MAG: hypothetical protein L0Y71_10925 [Gemmataceae bacterium]|nr:hypothetical protein [Gemmataceae bacterium]
MPDAYEVRSSGRINARIRDLYHEAARRGLASAFDSALRRIHERLSSDPKSLGEQTFTYHSLGLLNFAAVVTPLSLEFCVDDLRKIVYLRRIDLL